jgi:hypothetical protein
MREYQVRCWFQLRHGAQNFKSDYHFANFTTFVTTSGGSHVPSHNLESFSRNLFEDHSILNPMLEIYCDVVRKMPDNPTSIILCATSRVKYFGERHKEMQQKQSRAQLILVACIIFTNLCQEVLL